MKATKYVLLATSVVAIAAVFLFDYLVIRSGQGVTLWQFGHMGKNPHAWVILVAMALSLGFAAAALSRARLPRWQAIVSALAMAIGLFMAYAVFMKTRLSIGKDGALGAKLMLLALATGLVSALAGAIRPERATG